MCQTYLDYHLPYVFEFSRAWLTSEPGTGLHQRPWLPAQGALPRLKHDFHPGLSSCHLASFSWVLAGLSACARCDWQKARAMSAI